MKRTLAFIVCAVSMVFAAIDDPSFVKVEGSAGFSVAPDYANITIGFFDLNMSVDSAQKKVDSVSGKFFKLCKELEIDSTCITTDAYGISSKYDYDNNKSKQFMGYEVSLKYRIRILKISQIDTILAKTVQLGSNNITSVRFACNNEDSLKRVALVLAMKDARKNAEALLKPTNQKIVRLLKATNDPQGNFDINSNVGIQIEEQKFVKGGALEGSTGRPYFIRIIPGKVLILAKVYAIYQIQ